MNLRKVLIIIYFLTFCSVSLAQNADDNEFLKDLNSQLQQQKDALDPFAGEEVEIDIESLGLDDVNSGKKSAAQQNNIQDLVEENQIPYQEPEAPPVTFESTQQGEIINDIIGVDNFKNEEKSGQFEEGQLQPITPGSAKSQDIPDQTKAIKGVINKFHKDKTPKKEQQDIVQKEEEKKKISANKDNEKQKVKEKLPNEKKNTEEQNKKELEKLRKKYLYTIKDKAKIDDNYVMPEKKNINRYVIDEAPALPILSRFRTNENLHIPIIPTPRERIDNLFQAIASRNVGYFNSSFKYVQNPNVFNLQGDNLLTYSIIYRNYPALISILTKGADPNLPNKLGYSPAAIAIEIKDFDSFKLLFDSGADLDFRDRFDRTYLMYASRVGFLPAVEYLISKGADINARDVDGFTALAIAYKHKRDVIISYLIKNGAKTWSQDKFEAKKQSLIRELENRWK